MSVISQLIELHDRLQLVQSEIEAVEEKIKAEPYPAGVYIVPSVKSGRCVVIRQCGPQPTHLEIRVVPVTEMRS